MSDINNNIFGQVPDIDLSNFYTKQQVDNFLLSKANLQNNKLVDSEVPDLAITNVFSGPDTNARDTLVANGVIQTGDVFIITGVIDTGKTFMYNGSSWIVIENVGFTTIDDINITSSTTFSSQKIDNTYFSKTNLVNSRSTNSNQGYNVIYLNTELDNKLNKNVVNASQDNTASQIFNLTGDVLELKKIKGTAVSENSGVFTINQRPSEINDSLTNSTTNNYSITKLNQTFLQIANLVNSGQSSSTVSTYTANQINNLISNKLEGIQDAGASGISLHNGISNNNIQLKTITGSGVSESNNVITITQTSNIINDNSASTTSVYSSSFTDSRYILVSKLVNSSSTNVDEVYNVVYINTQLNNKLSKNVINNSNDLSASPIFVISGANSDILELKKIKGTAVSENSGVFTINKVSNAEIQNAVIDDNNITSTTTYSSNKIVNDYFLKSNIFSSFRTATTEVYSANYINSQFQNRLSTNVSNLNAGAGQIIWNLSNQDLRFYKLVAGSNITITDSNPSGLITISSSAGTALPSTTTEDQFLTSTTTAQTYQLSSKLSLNPARFGHDTPTLINNSSTFFGVGAGNSTSNTNILTGFGYEALQGSNVGDGNTGIGVRAGKNCNGLRNNFFGAYSGFNSTGNDNFYLGESAGDSSNRNQCIAIGRMSLRGGSGSNNIAIGINSLGSGYGQSSAFTGSNRFVVGHNINASLSKPYLLDCTLGDTDSQRTINLNADMLNLGSNLPNSSSGLRVWKNDGYLLQGNPSVLTIDTVNNRIGINITNPTEDLEIDGNIQIDTSGLGRLVFYDKQAGHEHCEVDGDDDGTNGGMFLIKIKQDGGSVVERFRIDNIGRIGIGGANYGTSGQVLTSNGSSAPTWQSLPADQNIYTTGHTFSNGILTLTLSNSTTLSNQMLPTNSQGYLYNNGSGSFSYSTPTSLPSQTGNQYKLLTTDGNTASWSNYMVFDTNLTENITNQLLRVKQNLSLGTSSVSSAQNINFYKDSVDGTNGNILFHRGVAQWNYIESKQNANYGFMEMGGRTPTLAKRMIIRINKENAGDADFTIFGDVLTIGNKIDHGNILTSGTKELNYITSTNTTNAVISRINHIANNASSVQKTYGQNLNFIGINTNTAEYGFEKIYKIQNGVLSEIMTLGKTSSLEPRSVDIQGDLGVDTIRFNDNTTMTTAPIDKHPTSVSLSNGNLILGMSSGSNVIGSILPTNSQGFLYNGGTGTLSYANPPDTYLSSISFSNGLLTATLNSGGFSNVQMLPTDSTGYLYNNGTGSFSYSTPTSLPSQTGNQYKLLTTDGTNASWSDYLKFDTSAFNVKCTKDLVLDYKLIVGSNSSSGTRIIESRNNSNVDGAEIFDIKSYGNNVEYNRFLTRIGDASNNYSQYYFGTQSSGLGWRFILGQQNSSDSYMAKFYGKMLITDRIDVSTGGITLGGITQTRGVQPPNSTQGSNYYVLTANGVGTWEWLAPSSGGASTFLQLTDCPSSYNEDRILVSTSSGIDYGPHIEEDYNNSKLCIGYGSSNQISNMSSNTISIGREAGNLHSSRSRENSVFIGKSCAQNTLAPASGQESLQMDNTVCIGFYAGANSDNLENSVIIGSQAGYSASQYQYANSVMIGGFAGYDSGTNSGNQNSYSNSFIGVYAGRNLLGAQNVALGRDCLYHYQKISTESWNNMAIGNVSMRNCYGSSNVAIGTSSMRYDQGGQGQATENIAIGNEAMLNHQNNPTRNIAIGKNSLKNSVSCYDNTIIGHDSAQNISSCGRNIVIGKSSFSNQQNTVDSIIIGNFISNVSNNKLLIGNINTTYPIIDGTFNSNLNSQNLTVNGSILNINNIDGSSNIASNLILNYNGNNTGSTITQILSNSKSNNNSQFNLSAIKSRIINNTDNNEEGEMAFCVAGTGYNISQLDEVFKIRGNLNSSTTPSMILNGILQILNIPTSSSGLPSGAIWKDSGGHLRIV
jgi:hypothetical protein